MPPALRSMERRWESIDAHLKSDDDHLPLEQEGGAEALRLSSLYPEWHLRAKCRGVDDVVFFGSHDPDVRPQFNLTEIAAAMSICEDCPVRRICLTEALVNRERYGVWGMSTQSQRKYMFKMIDEGSSIEVLVEEFFMSREKANGE